MDWPVPDGGGTPRYVAFELDELTRAKFVQDLTKNLGVDYFRTQATVTPTIGIYLVNDKDEGVGYYSIRCARGGGRCPSMETLRQTASNGRPLSEIEADDILNDLDSHLPHKGSAPTLRFDYVLPVTQSGRNPLWDEWDREPPQDPRLLVVFKGHSKPVLSVAFSPDSTKLASGSWDGTIRLWNVSTGTNTATLTGHAAEVRSVAFSPDGKTLASAGGRDLTIKLWDVASGNNTRTMRGHKEIVASVAFSPDGKILASGSWDHTIRLWDIATGKNIATLDGHSEYIDVVTFAPDGKTVASGSADDTVKLWDVISGNEVKTLRGHNGCVSSTEFHPNGKMLASASSDSSVLLWDVASGKNIATLKVPAPTACGPAIAAFSPDGKTLASGGLGRKIKLWDVDTRKGTVIFSGGSWSVSCLAFSADGKMLASGADSDDNSVKLWNMSIIPVRRK